MRWFFLLSLCFVGCATKLGTEIRIEGNAKAIRYVLTGGDEGELLDDSIVHFMYKTTADKSVSIKKENGVLVFESMSDSTLAAQARQKDMDNLRGMWQAAVEAAIAAAARAGGAP